MTNAKMNQVRAEVVSELDRINALNKGLRPSEVLVAAKHKNSPLHDEFEWDDKKAGHEFRLNQARRLIRVSVSVIDSPGGGVKIDPYVHVPPTQRSREDDDTREGVYLRASVVVQDIDKFARALSALQSKVRAAQTAAEELMDVAEDAPGDDAPERLARIALAIKALENAGAAVAALH